MKDLTTAPNNLNSCTTKNYSDDMSNKKKSLQRIQRCCSKILSYLNTKEAARNYNKISTKFLKETA